MLTVSVHESGRYLFPGSGFPAETGGAQAPRSAANVALPPFAGDDAYRRALAEVVVPVVRGFAPRAIVTQNGVDHHHLDPLSHLITTMPLYPEIWRTLRARRRGVRRPLGWRVGGGGYNPLMAPPRAWAALAPNGGRGDPRPLPEAWREAMREAGAEDPPLGWTETPARSRTRTATGARGGDRPGDPREPHRIGPVLPGGAAVRKTRAILTSRSE